jgi:hypothetical protein
MMAPEKVVGATIEGDMRKPGKKEWRCPELRKLPITATAGSTHTGGNDGNMGKNGSAFSNS